MTAMTYRRVKHVLSAMAAGTGLLVASAVAMPHAWAIYQGREAERDYSFVASLQFKTDDGPVHWCGAALIDPRWIVTAKHCMLPSIFDRLTRPSDLQVRIGSRDRTAGGERVDVVKIIVHGAPIDPSPTAGNDISGTDIVLLKLAHAVRAAPVTIAAATPKPGTGVRVLGWGLNCEAPRPTPTTPCADLPVRLRELDTQLLAKAGCRTKDPHDSQISARELCQAPAPDGGNVRTHDSGSPLLVKVRGRFQLAGAVSGPVVQDLHRDGPIIYTDVTAYRGWIRQQLTRG